MPSKVMNNLYRVLSTQVYIDLALNFCRSLFTRLLSLVNEYIADQSLTKRHFPPRNHLVRMSESQDHHFQPTLFYWNLLCGPENQFKSPLHKTFFLQITISACILTKKKLIQWLRYYNVVGYFAMP